MVQTNAIFRGGAVLFRYAIGGLGNVAVGFRYGAKPTLIHATAGWMRQPNRWLHCPFVVGASVFATVLL